MVLLGDDMDLLPDGDAEIACSICFDAVARGGRRSVARLECGHDFHLDCIGSAFNAKGVMQCPNCRKVEKGNWLYANGSFPLPDLNMHEWAHDEDLYDLSYSEMPFGIHWCPFGRLAPVNSSFEEGEYLTALPYHDRLGHHAVFTEHRIAPSTAQPCPYLGFLQPLRPSNDSRIFPETLTEPAYHSWSQVGLVNAHNPHALPAIDLHHHNWEHYPPAYSIHGSQTNSGNQASNSLATIRHQRIDPDGLSRAGLLIHPLILSSRAAGSFASSSVPYLGSSGYQAFIHEHYQRQRAQVNHRAVFTGVHRIRDSGGLATIWPIAGPPPDHTGFYHLVHPSGTSGQSFQDVESLEGSRSHTWEINRFAPFPLMRPDGDSSWWGPVPQPIATLESTGRMSFQYRRGAERPSQGRPEGLSYGPPIHASRIPPFI